MLHNYQRHAVDRILAEPAVGLFLDMGLGKTIIALTAIDELIRRREVSKVLIIAPKRVAENTWTEEAEKWELQLKIVKVLGSQKQRVKALQTEADVYVINRENIPWLVKYFDFDMVVIDELSSFKSSSSLRFRALRKVRPRIKKVVGLTGTPSPNGLIDLWSQIYLLDQGERLGRTLSSYRDRYFRPGRRNGHIVYEWIPLSEKAIHQKISDLCISMKAEDWLELPERVDRVVSVHMPSHAKESYKRMERDFIDGKVVADTEAVLVGKLLQMANGAVYNEDGEVEEIHAAKLDALESIIEAGKPVLVFYNYRHDLDRIRQRFNVRTLDSPSDIHDWNAGKIPILLAHPASAGHGLNLQAGGSVIVWFGLTWSLELYEQANARLHRQGQQEKVIIHHLVTAGTVDEDVMRALKKKSIKQNDLIQAVKARVSQ